MRALLIAILVAMCACETTPAPVALTTPAASASTATASRITYPGASPSLGHYAVMERAGILDLVSVARVNVIASVDFTPAAFRPNDHMPYTSESSTRLYFLTAAAEVRSLTPDGRESPATSIQLTDIQEAGFAVSPDDRRIAVSIFSYTTNAPDAAYLGMRLYVEDLAGGGNHVDIFTSPTLAEYPIGWVGGNLVVAVSAPHCCIGPDANPYGADSYHVVDPATGRRLASICSSGAIPWGPVEPAGAMCGPQTFVRWTGAKFLPPAAVPDPGPYRAALSPDGTEVLVGGSPIRVLRGSADFRLDLNGFAMGWVDGVNVVIATADNTYWMLDARTGVGAQTTGETAYLGTLPVAIS